ncbi:MAG: glycosyltransferase family 2 protein [Acidimicrobiales bacterium]
MTTPRVSIGMPVRNGEALVSQAIRSHLEQTLEDFELVICDNASTDATEEVCREFVAADPRVSYHRQPENVGAARNYNDTLARASGRYFKWAAHDDVVEPTYLARCVERLEDRPDVVLACSRIARIDAEGKALGVEEYGLRVESPRPSVRFRDIVAKNHSCFQIFGVMRTDILRRTPGHGAHVGADRNLLAEMALYGPFAVVDEVLFKRRVHEGAYSGSHMSLQEQAKWHDPHGNHASGDDIRRAEYRAALARTALSDSERRACERVLRVDYPLSKLAYQLRRRAARVKRRLKAARAT